MDQSQKQTFHFKGHGKPLESFNHLSLVTVLSIGCRAARVGAGPPGTELTDLTGLEMMATGVAVAAVKAMGSDQITDILWRKSRKPSCSVNKQINRNINRK